MSDKKNLTKIVKSGEDVVKLDARGRVIKKVPSIAEEVATKVDLERFTTSEDLDKKYCTKAEAKAIQPNLESYLTKVEAQRYILKKNLNAYPNRLEVANLIASQEFEALAKKEEIVDLVHKAELKPYVTREELARIISPGLLAKLVTKGELSNYATKESLKELATKNEVIRKKAGSQVISGSLEVSGDLTEGGSKLQNVKSKDSIPTRIVKSAPAKLTEDDEYVTIVNNSSELFGVILPKGRKGLKFSVKDGAGNSYHSNIKIVTTGEETIDGRSSFVLNENYSKVTLVHNGKEWNVF